MTKGLLFLTSFLLCFSATATIRLAVTVDDLPIHGGLPPGVTREDVAAKMIATLKKYKIPEPYGFINAAKVDEAPSSLKVLKMWREAGFPLGNHTWSHINLNKATAAEFNKETDQNEKMLIALSGGTDWHYFRYPYLHEGETIEKREAVRDHLMAQKYKIAEVTVDFGDWAYNNPYARCMTKKDSKSLEWLKKSYIDEALEMLKYDDLLAQKMWKRPIAHILLLHIGAFDAEMFDALFKAYQDAGVEFIPLSEAVKDKIYEFDPKVEHAFGDEFMYPVLQSRHQTEKDLGLPHIGGVPLKKLEGICK